MSTSRRRSLVRAAAAAAATAAVSGALLLPAATAFADEPDIATVAHQGAQTAPADVGAARDRTSTLTAGGAAAAAGAAGLGFAMLRRGRTDSGS
ncbi:hypothetical protein AB0M39_01140 [Streptomyces sp. NPDC051907]|uniref:hypothetical protein n=1 Tax=Streptomyces sp. NPDC051907 TaxID=3155284 RepID=UPI00343C8E3B